MNIGLVCLVFNQSHIFKLFCLRNLILWIASHTKAAETNFRMANTTSINLRDIHLENAFKVGIQIQLVSACISIVSIKKD